MKMFEKLRKEQCCGYAYVLQKGEKCKCGACLWMDKVEKILAEKVEKMKKKLFKNAEMEYVILNITYGEAKDIIDKVFGAGK